MKNYSQSDLDAKQFILSYELEQGKIFVKLASGEIYSIPYTRENEKNVIARMEKQAREAQPKELKMLDKIMSVTQPLILPISIINFMNNGGWFYAFLLGIILSGAIYYPIKVIKNVLQKKDIKKMNYFLNVKEELNENIEKSENLKLGISKKAAKEIELQSSKKQEVFNINNIDNYSLNDLKTIRENIKRMISFGFEEETSKSFEEKEPVLTKK